MVKKDIIHVICVGQIKEGAVGRGLGKDIIFKQLLREQGL